MNTAPKLSFACPMPWNEMTGTERLKYCAQCGHHVANLSLMPAADRAILLERAKTERLCGSYFLRLSGEMVTPEAPLSSAERQRVKQFGVAVLSAAAMALASGCISTNSAQNAPVIPGPATAAAGQDQVKKTPECVEATKVTDKKEDEVVLLLGGVIFEVQPTRKPGRSGK